MVYNHFLALSNRLNIYDKNQHKIGYNINICISSIDFLLEINKNNKEIFIN